MAKAYQTSTGAILATAITGVGLREGISSEDGTDVIIYTGSKEHIFFNGVDADAQTKYSALLTDLGLTVTTSDDL